MTRLMWLELLGMTAVASALSASLVLSAGEWSWSWDALNHHVYLGMIAETPRWHLDVLAASVQSYQYPYLYWPIYRLSLLPLRGEQIGALWAAFQTALLLPPVWLASRHLLPKQGAAMQAVFERTAACALALSSIVVMGAVGTTSNDPLTAVPLLWGVALMTAPRPDDRRAVVAAALLGVSVAFKWSNALALPLLLLWWWSDPPHLSPWRAALLALGTALGFMLAYGPWGLQLWRETGNPIYPFLGRW